MNDEAHAAAENLEYRLEQPLGESVPLSTVPATPPPIPEYLQDTYWWAYLHPKSFWFFEREWVVNLILWGNMRKLTQAVIKDLDPQPRENVLQVACVYGQFSNILASSLAESDSTLDIVDVAPIQLANVKKKLAGNDNVGVHHRDSSKLGFTTHSYDQTVVFFLLHEMPEDVRRKTIEEAIRVTRPGGKVIFVDYHGPRHSNPMRYVMKPVLTWLEPFAMDLWRDELPAFFPDSVRPEQISSEFYFGGLYQKVVVSV